MFQLLNCAEKGFDVSSGDFRVEKRPSPGKPKKFKDKKLNLIVDENQIQVKSTYTSFGKFKNNNIKIWMA